MDQPGAFLNRDCDANRRSPSTATLFRWLDAADAAAIQAAVTMTAAITESLDDAVVGLNTENEIVVWNHSAETLFGRTANVALGEPITTFGITPVPDTFDEILPSLLRQAGVTSFVTRRRVDGTHGPVHTIAIQRPDVPASRGDVEPGETVQERRLRSILEAAADAIVTIDAGGTIQSFNPAAEHLFGFTASEIVGTNVSRLMPSPYRDEHDEYLARYCETRVPHVIGSVREMVALRKDGSSVPIELAITEVESGRQFTGIVRDVTERKDLQEQLLTIAESEKRRIGQDLHDDIGQEMTGLGLTAETLLEALDEYSLPEADLAARLARGIRRTLQKLRRISRGLLPFEVEAHRLVPALIELTAQLELADGIQCSFDCPTPVALDDRRVATQLYRIAQEATANAVRHARAQHIAVSLTAADRALVLRVRDDGIGIGSGLESPGNGLQIMRHRAGLIGADLSIGSAAGGGTEVVCRLPHHVHVAATHFGTEGACHER